jgi:hypothetical protein
LSTDHATKSGNARFQARPSQSRRQHQRILVSISEFLSAILECNS